MHNEYEWSDYIECKEKTQDEVTLAKCPYFTTTEYVSKQCEDLYNATESQKCIATGSWMLTEVLSDIKSRFFR